MSVFGLWKGSSWARLPVFQRKCDSGDDRPLQPIGDPTAARSLVWSLNITSLTTAEGFFTTVSVCECRRENIWMLVCGLSCSVCIWPPGRSQTPIIPLLHCQHTESRLYLTCGISEEVTDVRNHFTERQTLRSKPAKTKYIINRNFYAKYHHIKTHSYILFIPRLLCFGYKSANQLCLMSVQTSVVLFEKSPTLLAWR